MTPSAEPRKNAFGADLAPRVASAAVLIAAALAVTYVGGVVFALFWFLAFAAIAWEWLRLIAAGHPSAKSLTALCWLALLAATVLTRLGEPQWALLAIGAGAAGCAAAAPSGGPSRAMAGGAALYAGLPLLAVLSLRGDAPEGRLAMFWLYAVVWATDIAAYFVGRQLRGPKLWPSVSPGKTWSGAVGGTICGAAAGLALAGATNDVYVLTALGLGASLASQAGDLFESALKRRYGAKDSSTLIPGHGGVMDRLDGFVAAAVLAAIVALVNAEGPELGAGLFRW